MIQPFKNWKPEIAPSCYIHDTSVIIGRVKMAANVSVWPMAVLRGDIEEIVIGENSNVQDCAVLHVNLNRPLYIGRDVTIGHGAVVHGAVVGDGCLIGMKAVVLETEIGENSLIAAGALVSAGRKIPPRSLVMGVPGKVVRELTAEEIALLKHHSDAYLQLALEYKPKPDDRKA